jgi:hypothetical protein
MGDDSHDRERGSEADGTQETALAPGVGEVALVRARVSVFRTSD